MTSKDQNMKYLGGIIFFENSKFSKFIKEYRPFKFFFNLKIERLDAPRTHKEIYLKFMLV